MDCHVFKANVMRTEQGALAFKVFVFYVFHFLFSVVCFVVCVPASCGFAHLICGVQYFAVFGGVSDVRQTGSAHDALEFGFVEA